jgi:hypothetical protein
VGDLNYMDKSVLCHVEAMRIWIGNAAMHMYVFTIDFHQR